MKKPLPVFWGVTRHFDQAAIADPSAECARKLETFLDGARADVTGRSVAVCVGSRGIASLPNLVRATVETLRRRGARPFIVPCMGSHGGATPEGQTALLSSLKVSAESMGAEVRSGMEVRALGALEGGPELLFSSEALAADFILPIARVKQHTILEGDVQSGLCKMLVIGCGKHAGATLYHRHGIEAVLVPGASALIERLPLLCGIAVVENSVDRLCELRVAGAADFITTDRELLRLAKSKLPTLPFTALDGLIIDAIGKDISGAGADVNVIGKWRREGGPRIPDYRLIAVLGITPASHGNATGIGNADLMPERLLKEMDYPAMRINVLTSGTIRSACLPLAVENDEGVLRTMLDSVPQAETARLARIRDTLHLGRFWVSDAVRQELAAHPDCVVDDEPQECRFDADGLWLPFA